MSVALLFAGAANRNPAAAAAPAPLMAPTTTVQTVGGSAVLEGIACPSAGTCEAVGYDSSGTGVVVKITGGVPGTPFRVPGTALLRAVACPTATTCEAVGFVGTSPPVGVVVAIVDGSAGVVHPIAAPSGLVDIACVTATSCVAVGSSGSSPPLSVVVTIADGTPGVPRTLSGPALIGVACTTATTCEAVGLVASGGAAAGGVILPITDGVPGRVQVVPHTRLLWRLACSTATTCIAVGDADTGVVVPITAGNPGAAQPVPGTDELLDIGCRAAVTCVAVGNSIVSGIAVEISGTSAGVAEPIESTSFLVDVACATPVTCEAVGVGTDGVGVVATLRYPGAVKAATTTTLSARPAGALFGSTVTFTASVVARRANARRPTGLVRFFVNGSPTAVATVGLAAGKAVFRTAGLGAGDQTVTATYSGDAGFEPSSGTTTLTVGVTRSLSGDLAGGLVVRAGTAAILRDAHVNGSVTVQPGGALDIENSTIVGSLGATGPSGFVLVGDSGDDGCAPDSIGGSLILSGNSGGLEAIGNQVGGTVTNVNNSGAGAFAEDTSPEVGPASTLR